MVKNIRGITPELLISGMLNYKFRGSDSKRLSATELSTILMDLGVYPNYRNRPDELVSDLKNYGPKKFSKEDIVDALNYHFKDKSEAERQKIMDDVYGVQGTPLTDWAGSYSFSLAYYRGQFTPLAISQDGKITLQGIPVENYIYDPVKSELSFSTVEIPDRTNPHARNIVFKIVDGRKTFNGIFFACPSGCGPLDTGGFAD